MENQKHDYLGLSRLIGEGLQMTSDEDTSNDEGPSYEDQREDYWDLEALHHDQEERHQRRTTSVSRNSAFHYRNQPPTNGPLHKQSWSGRSSQLHTYSNPTFTNPMGLESRHLRPRPMSRKACIQHREDMTITNPTPRGQRMRTVCNSRLRKGNSMWSDDQLKAAMDAVDGGSSMREASRKFHVPYSSLCKWCYGMRSSCKRGPPTVLNAEEEQLIVNYLVSMCELGYGLTPTALRLKVYEIT